MTKMKDALTMNTALVNKCPELYTAVAAAYMHA